MGIITISRGSCERGTEVAEKLAKKLGYECSSREILLQVSKTSNGPGEKKMPTIQDDSTTCRPEDKDKLKQPTFSREAFLEYIRKDNVVYHGFAGHFFMREIPNILKVRIIASMDYRIKLMMEQKKFSEDKARKTICDIDAERWQWERYLYGIDTNNSELYDLIIKIDCLDVDDLVDIIYNMAMRPCFQTTPESRRKLEEMLAAAKAYSSSSSQLD